MTSGFRTFTAGEVLTASNVQNYLMDQSVMTFAGSAARSSAIGTANFEEGMTSYLKDTDKLETYNGTNWVAIGPATTTQGLTLINTTSFSGVSSVSLPDDSFTSTYDHYKILLTLTSTPSAYLRARVRAAGSDLTTANYAATQIQGAYASNTLGNDNQGIANTISTIAFVDGSTTTNITIEIMNPKTTNFTAHYATSDRAGYGLQVAGGVYKATTSVDSFSFIPASGTISGNYSLYGYNK